MTKYVKRSGNIDADYRYYLGREGLYKTLYGHKLTNKERQKRDYIWKQLLKSYGRMR